MSSDIEAGILIRFRIYVWKGQGRISREGGTKIETGNGRDINGGRLRESDWTTNQGEEYDQLSEPLKYHF